MRECLREAAAAGRRRRGGGGGGGGGDDALHSKMGGPGGEFPAP